MKQAFMNYKIPPSKLFEHNGQTKFINRSNIQYLNKIITSELVDERNRDLPFVTFHFDDDVLPCVYDEHVHSILRDRKVTDDKTSVFCPTRHELQNLFDENGQAIGIQCGVDSIKNVKVSNSFYKAEREALLEEIATSAALTIDDTGLKLKSDAADVYERVFGTDKTESGGKKPKPKRIKLTSSSKKPVPASKPAPSLSKNPEDIVIPISQRGRSSKEIEGGLIGGGLEINDQCNCETDKCTDHKKPGRNLWHLAYIQQYRMQEYNRKITKERENSEETENREKRNQSLYPDPARQFELCLSRLATLEKKETLESAYPIVKTYLRFQQRNEAEGVKSDTKFDMSLWPNLIRECFLPSFDSGITYPWTYMGLANTLFLVHLEDFKAVNSVNLLIYGRPKVWIFIKEENQQAFENLITKHLKDRAQKSLSLKSISSNAFPSCLIGHKSFFIHPHLLDQLEIDYTVFVQEVGDMVVTKRNAYHWGINLGVNIAYAQNAIFEDYILDVLQNQPDPYSCRPFCPPSICNYKPTTGYFSEAEVYLFFCKLLKCIIQRSQIKFTDAEITNFFLILVSNNHKISNNEKSALLGKIGQVSREILLELEAIRKEVKPFLYVIDKRTSIKTCRTTVACTYRTLDKSAATLKTTPQDPLSSVQLKSFFRHHAFQSIRYNYLNLTDPSQVVRTEDKVSTLRDIFAKWNAMDDTIMKRFFKEENDSSSKHAQDLKSIATLLLKYAKLTPPPEQQSSKVIYTPTYTDLVCLQEPNKNVFLCLICIQNSEVKNLIKNEIEAYRNQPKYVSFEDKVCSFEINLTDINDGCIGSYKTITAVNNHASRKTNKLVCMSAECTNKEKKPTKEFQTSENAIAHLRVEHEKWNIFCPICSDTLHSPEQFKRHFRGNKTPCIKLQYDGSLENELDILQFICPGLNCSKKFPNLEEVIQHFKDSLSCVNGDQQTSR